MTGCEKSIKTICSYSTAHSSLIYSFAPNIRAHTRTHSCKRHGQSHTRRTYTLTPSAGQYRHSMFAKHSNNNNQIPLILLTSDRLVRQKPSPPPYSWGLKHFLMDAVRWCHLSNVYHWKLDKNLIEKKEERTIWNRCRCTQRTYFFMYFASSDCIATERVDFTEFLLDSADTRLVCTDNDWTM